MSSEIIDRWYADYLKNFVPNERVTGPHILATDEFITGIKNGVALTNIGFLFGTFDENDFTICSSDEDEPVGFRFVDNGQSNEKV